MKKNKFKQIDFDDDIVVVKENGKIIYNGLEDYEPMKYENWKWNEKECCYVWGKYKKYCLIF